MSMVPCPYCNETVSEFAVKCPHCGNTLKESEKATLVCAECGNEIPEGADTCPRCGCPVDRTLLDTQKVELTKISLPSAAPKLKRTILTACVILVVVIIGSVVGIQVHQESVARREEEAAAQAMEEYQSNLNTAVFMMLIGAADAESSCGLIHDVWYNTIYEKSDSTTDKYTRTRSGLGSFFNSDFNTSLRTLFSDSDFSSKIDSIRQNQSSTAELMKSLSNPPETYRDAYDAVKNLYDSYLILTDLAVNPTGNLQSYTSSFNTADADFSKYYKVMDIYTT